MSAAPPLEGDPLAAAILPALPHSPSVWAQAWTRLRRDRVGMASLWVVLAFAVLVLLAQLQLVGADWQREVGNAVRAAARGRAASPTVRKRSWSTPTPDPMST